MKFKKVFLLIVSIFSLISCNNDEPTNSQDIVGKWVNEGGYLCYVFNMDGTGYYMCIGEDSPADYPYKYTVKKDIIEISYLNGNWSIEGEKEKFKYILSSDNQKLTLQLIGECTSDGKWHEYTDEDWKIYNRR